MCKANPEAMREGGAYTMYERFRPEGGGWGERSSWKVERLHALRREIEGQSLRSRILALLPSTLKDLRDAIGACDGLDDAITSMQVDGCIYKDKSDCFVPL